MRIFMLHLMTIMTPTNVKIFLFIFLQFLSFNKINQVNTESQNIHFPNLMVFLVLILQQGKIYSNLIVF